MKYYNKLLLGAISLGILTACADESLLQPGESVQKPEEMVQLEYLNQYDVLKNYVNRGENPNFKLGVAIAASDFLKKELVYGLAVSNFDEMTAGNAMKYASIVKDDGSADFSQVTSFVQTAKEAGMTVYGHTLCWHSQQNKTYLEKLIAPTVIPGEGGDGGRCLVLKNASALANNYDAQTWYQFDAPLANGQKYKLKFMAKASSDFAPEIYLQSSHKEGKQQYPGSVSTIGTTWQEITFYFTPSDALVDRVAFNFGSSAVEIYIDNITLTADGSDENLIANSDFEDGTITGWTGWTPGKFETISEDGKGYATQGASWDPSVFANADFEKGIQPWNGWGNNSTHKQSAEGQGYNSSYSLEITNPSAAESYQAQIAYDFSSPLVFGGTYCLKMKIKGSVSGKISASLQRSSDYKGAGEFPEICVDTDWTTYEGEVVVSGEGADNANRFLLNVGSYKGTLYVDDITLCYSNPNGGGNDQIEEMPDEKKKMVLTNALEDWIKGMMAACKENPNIEEGESAGATLVKAWDVVNEPMSDRYPSQLKSAATEGEENAAQSFYWQDYLGKEYAREVVKFARKYGGEDLKLFVNDYNLEAAYNNNAKCQGLIDMIAYWEADGVTIIDGIGTQMHVSYSLNPEEQAKNEACVVKMFQLLAASGKLVKISELDMGILDESGTEIKTENVTLEQQKLMSDYYQFIISKYFEIIPQSQRYGITQWSSADSPVGSGWRAGLPIGLWNLNYDRKPTYAGFANGLAGKIIEPESTGK